MTLTPDPYDEILKEAERILHQSRSYVSPLEVTCYTSLLPHERFMLTEIGHHAVHFRLSAEELSHSLRRIAYYTDYVQKHGVPDDKK